MERIKNYFKIYYIFIAVIAILVIGYLYLTPNTKDEFIKIFVYLGNQTVAVLIGFFGLILGYSIWRKQHHKELVDKYFSEYLDAVYRFVAIKKEEADLRKGKNRRFNEIKDKNEDDERLLEINKQLSGLNRQEIQNEGLLKSRRFLLKEFNDKRWQKSDEIKNNFGKKYKEFSIKSCDGKDALRPDVYEEAVNCINVSIDETLEKLEKL